MDKTILCRKCGGPHFTIKCGKEKKEEPIKSESVNDLEPESSGDKGKYNKDSGDKGKYNKDSGDKNKYNKDSGDKGKYNKDSKPYGEKKYFKVTYRVKLSELPTNMSEEELMDMTTDWGHIVRIKLLIYEESSTAYIDFGYEDEAIYFVEAIDKTSFEYKILSACRVDSYKAESKDSSTTNSNTPYSNKYYKQK